jgi:hypothetical protein
MKKTVLAIALATILAAGVAFADHPKGWGIGLQGGWTGGWGGIGWGGGALTLKAPSFPIFFAVSGGIHSNSFTIGVAGDYYLIDKVLVPDIKLGWYLGVGGYISFYNHSETYFNEKYSASGFGLGARVPIGLSWQPLNFLELYADFAPSLGIAFQGEGKYKDKNDGNKEKVWRKAGVDFPDGGYGFDFGIRFWL